MYKTIKLIIVSFSLLIIISCENTEEASNTSEACDIQNPTIIQLGESITLNFAAESRFDCEAIKVGATSGSTLSISIQDEWTGLTDGADSVIEIYESSNNVTSNSPSIIIDDNSNKLSTPIQYYVSTGDAVIIKILNDNGVSSEQHAIVTVN